MSAAPISVRPSRETLGEKMLRHGHTVGRANGRRESITYVSWSAMRSRCLNPKTPRYQQYGARGIGIDPRWDDFAAFLEDMGERPSVAYSLDRTDGAKGYGPDNCRWATRAEQRRNQARNRRVRRSDGLEFRTMAEAAEATGGNDSCIRDVCTGRQKTHLGFTWSFVE